MLEDDDITVIIFPFAYENAQAENVWGLMELSRYVPSVLANGLSVL